MRKPEKEPAPGNAVSQKSQTLSGRVPFSRWACVAVLAGVLLFGLAGAFLFFQKKQEGHSGVSPTLENIYRLSEIAFFTNGTFPPMSYRVEQGRRKTLVGFDVDLGKRIGGELGFQGSVDRVDGDKLFDFPNDREIDAVISAMTITEANKETYAFSDPYLMVGQVILVGAKEEGVELPEHLARKKVGVRSQSASEEFARAYASENLIVSSHDFIELVAMLASGQIDAVVADAPAAAWAVKEHSTLKIANDPFAFVSYRIAARKEDGDLVLLLNRAIRELRNRGVIEELKQKWFSP